MTKRKCSYIKEDYKTKCKAAAFAPVRVNVIHTDTGRKSKQTWHLCEKHFHLFMETKGKQWQCIYLSKPNKRALVTGFQILDGLDYGYRS